jgi:hypothetical protein
LKTTTYTGSAGVTLRLLSWLTGGLSYSYLNQQSLGSVGEDGDRNTVMLTLTASAPTRRIVR